MHVESPGTSGGVPYKSDTTGFVNPQSFTSIISNPNDIYNTMCTLTDQIPVGSGGIIFNPSLAGGISQDKSVNILGSFLGLNLSTTRDHMIRAAMEGIAMNLKISIDYLAEHTSISNEILFCSGGSKSDIWMQMFADIFNMRIIKTNIGLLSARQSNYSLRKGWFR